MGRVVIGDNVEIGADTTIDRGAVPDTVIGEGTRIDNLVQIGHNVEIGRMCIVVAQVGLLVAPRLVTVFKSVVRRYFGASYDCNGARVAGGSGVIRDVGPNETVGGLPALPIRPMVPTDCSVVAVGEEEEKLKWTRWKKVPRLTYDRRASHHGDDPASYLFNGLIKLLISFRAQRQPV